MASSSRAWRLVPGEDKPSSDPTARLEKETFHLREDDLARFIDEAVARRRGRGPHSSSSSFTAQGGAGFYETALRALGGYIDQQQPRDVFFFEQEHQFVIRLLMATRTGLRHVLVEFTREEVEAMIAAAHNMRGR